MWVLNFKKNSSASPPHTFAPSNDPAASEAWPGLRFYPPLSRKLPLTTRGHDDLSRLHHVSFVIFSHVLALHSPGSSSHGLYISVLSTSLHSSQPGGSVSGFWAQSPGNHSGLAGRLEPQVKHSSFPQRPTPRNPAPLVLTHWEDLLCILGTEGRLLPTTLLMDYGLGKTDMSWTKENHELCFLDFETSAGGHTHQRSVFQMFICESLVWNLEYIFYPQK